MTEHLWSGISIIKLSSWTEERRLRLDCSNHVEMMNRPFVTFGGLAFYTLLQHVEALCWLFGEGKARGFDVTDGAELSAYIGSLEM